MTLDTILEEIKKANSIVLLTHDSPDGDAIGSVLAMKLALKSIGKESDVILEEFPRVYDYLPGANEIKSESDVKKYDLAIVLDSATFKRTIGTKYFEAARRTIVIDHHGSNTMFGDVNYVNHASPACCEVLAAMFTYYDIEITRDIGICILTGIITDTGGFQYSSVTPETFEFTAELLRKGVRVSDIYRKALKTQTKSAFELQKIAANRIEFLENNKVTFTYITKEDEKAVGAEAGDHEGIVNMGRDVEDVEVSIFIRQAEAGKDIQKVSLRSKSYVNVSDVGLMFGGGGHPKAAGATIPGTVEQVKKKVLTEIKKVLK